MRRLLPTSTTVRLREVEDAFREFRARSLRLRADDHGTQPFDTKQALACLANGFGRHRIYLIAPLDGRCCIATQRRIREKFGEVSGRVEHFLETPEMPRLRLL